MQRLNVIRLALAGFISIGITACEVHSKAEFDMALDPNVRGKVNLINHSSNASNFQWHLATSDTENGNYGSSSEYGNYGTFDGSVDKLYIKENTWIEVTLEATGLTSASKTKKLHVNNIPEQVAIGDMVVTRVNLRDELGYEWDDTDGMPNSGTYDVAGEYPDLLVNNSNFATTYSASDATWDVNIESGLPVTLTTEHEIFDNLSGFANTDYYVELVDFDGPPGSIFLAPGKRIGVLTIDVRRLTHDQNGGSDDNYPEVYKIVEDGFEADLYMNWD